MQRICHVPELAVHLKPILLNFCLATNAQVNGRDTYEKVISFPSWRLTSLQLKYILLSRFRNTSRYRLTIRLELVVDS